MSKGSKRLAIAILSTALAWGTAAAQPVAPVAGGATRQVPVNTAEQAASARNVVQRGVLLVQRLNTMLDEARRESDIIRVTCLNDKLTQANANMRTAQARYSSFESTADADQKKHEATMLTVLGQKFTLLDQEANRCVGQDLYETGKTKVQTEIDTALLPFEPDPATPPAPPSPVVPITPLAASATGTGE